MIDQAPHIYIASNQTTQTVSVENRTSGVTPVKHSVEMNGKHYSCYVGKNGISANRKEGDRTTPVGDFGLKMVLFRGDRISKNEIKTKLPLREMTPNDGWCDDPKHPKYNQYVKLPFSARHERLWMQENYYDLMIVTDYNMNPIIPGKGSAIFIHIKDKDTEGCLGFSKKDLLEIVNQSNPGTRIKVKPDGKIVFYQTK